MPLGEPHAVVRAQSLMPGVVGVMGLSKVLHISEREVHVGGVGMDLPVVPGSAPLKRTGNRMWDAALLLVEHLRDRHDLPDCVVDLGAGTGVVGIACHVLGVDTVFLTDLPSQLPLLEENSQANRSSCGEVCVTELDWSALEQAQAIAQRLTGSSMWIIACEVIYPRGQQSSLVADLFDVISALLLSWESSALVLLAYQERSEVVTASWRRRAAEDGFCVMEVARKGAATIFELRLPREARQALAAKRLASETSMAMFVAQWEELLIVAPHFAEKQAAAKEFVLQFADIAAGLVVWHASRMLREFMQAVRGHSWLRGGAVPTSSPTSLDVRLVAAARMQTEALEARLRVLELPGSACDAHSNLVELYRGVQRLHTIVWSLPEDAAEQDDMASVCQRLLVGATDFTYSLPPVAPQAAKIAATSVECVGDSLVCEASERNLSTFTASSLEDVVADLYAAIMREVGIADDPWSTKMAEALLELLDELSGSNQDARALANRWLAAWSSGTAEEDDAAGPSAMHLNTSRRMELSANLVRLLDSDVGPSGKN